MLLGHLQSDDLCEAIRGQPLDQGHYTVDRIRFESAVLLQLSGARILLPLHHAPIIKNWVIVFQQPMDNKLLP